MRLLAASVLAASLALTLLPSAAADDDHPPACQGYACVDPDVELCSAITRQCYDPDHPVDAAKAIVKWVKGLFGPCTCDPQPDPI